MTITDLRLLEITWLLIICLASYALGKTIIQRIRLELTSRLENVLFCLALGFGCLSLITLGIGIAGGLYPWVFWILLGGIIIFCVKRKWGQQFFSPFSHLSPPAFFSCPFPSPFYRLTACLDYSSLVYSRACTYHDL
ncbi:MAG: hypothetical protein ABH870_08100 [bacterium]